MSGITARIELRAFLVLMLALGPGFLQAGEPVYAFGPEGIEADLNRGLSPEELYYNPREDFFYGENWHHMAKLDQGYVIYTNVFITNMGLTRPSCAVEFSILTPDGKTFTSKRDYGRDLINASTDSFSIHVAGNFIGGEYPEYRIHLEQDEMVVDLEFRNITPGWKYNSGFVYFGSDRRQFWKYMITSPSAAVSGTLEFDGREIQVSGFGFQDHSWMNIAVTSFSRRWVHFRHFSDERTIIVTEILTSEEYAPDKIVLALAAEGNRIIYQGSQAEVEFGDLVKDDEYGYSYPREISLEIKDEGFSLTGQLKVKRLLERIVVLSHINSLLRGIVHTFIARPVYYRCLNEFELVMDDGGGPNKIQGEALNEVVFIK